MRSEFEILLRKTYLYHFTYIEQSAIQESTVQHIIQSVQYGRCAGSTLVRLQ